MQFLPRFSLVSRTPSSSSSPLLVAGPVSPAAANAGLSAATPIASSAGAAITTSVLALTDGGRFGHGSGVARTLHLPQDGTSVPLHLTQPMRLRVLSGRVWITRRGWPQDHWLAPGETLDLAPASRWRRLHLTLSGEGEPGITLKLEPIV